MKHDILLYNGFIGVRFSWVILSLPERSMKKINNSYHLSIRETFI